MNARAAKSSVTSMTGFARREGGDQSASWWWEVKSVNGRGLDLRCRLPAGYEALEPKVRAATSARLQRGNIQISLQLRATEGAGQVRVNEALLEQAIRLSRELAERLGGEPPRVEALLGLRGVLEVVEAEPSADEMEARLAVLLADLEQALGSLLAERQREGVQLGKLVSGHLARLSELAGQAEDSAAAQPEQLKARLEAQVRELLERGLALPEERLAQEVALLAAKADVREEIDRLKAHLEAATQELAKGGAVGRRLDFLCQELNREANTLCAKAADVTLTQVGLELKAVIDQLREQVQNIT